jgi:hypothetical protein
MIEVSERILFDLRGNLSEFLPFGDRRRFLIAPLHRRPEETIVHWLMDVILHDGESCTSSGFSSSVLVPPVSVSPT